MALWPMTRPSRAAPAHYSATDAVEARQSVWPSRWQTADLIHV
jgi:hypothetical protein